MSEREERDRRIAEITEELKPLHARIGELSSERAELVTANAREDWPDGPFRLHYWRYFSEEHDDYDTPTEALAAARSIEDYGSGSTEKITDRNGNEVYDLTGYPPARLVDGYPEPDER